MARAASTYCISRMDSTLARMTRAARGMIGIEMAMTTFWIDGPERRRHDEGEHQQRQPLQDVHDALGDEIGLAARRTRTGARSPRRGTEPSRVDARLTMSDTRAPCTMRE